MGVPFGESSGSAALHTSDVLRYFLDRALLGPATHPNDAFLAFATAGKIVDIELRGKTPPDEILGPAAHLFDSLLEQQLGLEVSTDEQLDVFNQQAYSIVEAFASEHGYIDAGADKDDSVVDEQFFRGFMNHVVARLSPETPPAEVYAIGCALIDIGHSWQDNVAALEEDTWIPTPDLYEKVVTSIAQGFVFAAAKFLGVQEGEGSSLRYAASFHAAQFEKEIRFYGKNWHS